MEENPYNLWTLVASASTTLFTGIMAMIGIHSFFSLSRPTILASKENSREHGNMSLHLIQAVIYPAEKETGITGIYARHPELEVTTAAYFDTERFEIGALSKSFDISPIILPPYRINSTPRTIRFVIAGKTGIINKGYRIKAGLFSRKILIAKP